MITKEEVHNALELIDKYKIQESNLIKELQDKSIRQKDTRSLVSIGLKTREINALASADIYTVGDLLSADRSQVILYRNMGRGGIRKINKALEDDGIVTAHFSLYGGHYRY